MNVAFWLSRLGIIHQHAEAAEGLATADVDFQFHDSAVLLSEHDLWRMRPSASLRDEVASPHETAITPEPTARK